jgi:hypothetical protein
VARWTIGSDDFAPKLTNSLAVDPLCAPPSGHIEVGLQWPEVKPLLRRALEMRRQIAREGWWN